MRFFFSLLFCSFVFSSSAQQFSQYNTGTLFDSFEHPAQRAFIPDSSRQFAFNFFVPHFGSSGSFSGNGQQSIRSLINNGTYNSSNLVYGMQNRNNLNLNVNTYWFMAKMYGRLDGDQEFGLSAQTKAEGYGNMSDETLLLLDSYKNLANETGNTDLFNGRAQAQTYHQLSISYRKKLSPSVAFGVKLSGLLGIYYTKLNIQHSGFQVYDSIRATLFLQGNYAYSSDEFRKRDILGLKNPGAAISFGLQAQLENGILLQANLKDLGFIRWNKNAVTYAFNRSQNVDRISTTNDNSNRILTETDSIISTNGSKHAFYAPINGNADLAISKKINFLTTDLYAIPTFIVSKSLFYEGLTGALMSHFTYKSLWFTALASYNDNRVWNGGAQLMIKSPNAEFYFGTEQAFRSAKFFHADNNSKATGINAFIGFSAKFGRLIEHPAAASYIPIGEPKGFFDRVWRRIFKPASY